MTAVGSALTSTVDLGRTAVLMLAAPADNIPPEKGAEWGKAAPIGLLVILLLAVAVFFLIKNMNKQMRKVPEQFEGEPDEPGDRPAGPGHGDPPAADPNGFEGADQAGEGPVGLPADGRGDAPPVSR